MLSIPIFISAVVWGILFLLFFLLVGVVGYVSLVVSDGKEGALDRHRQLLDRGLLSDR